MSFDYLNLPAPMLVQKPKSAKDLMDKITSGKYFGSCKKDGYLYQLVKDAAGEIFLFSRTVSRETHFFSEKIANVPHLKKWAKNNMPPDSILLGEVYYPHKTSKDVTTIMGCKPRKAMERQLDIGPIHFYIHDILRWHGSSFIFYSNLDRVNFLKAHLRVEPSHPFIEMADFYFDDLPHVLDSMFEAGEEGMVFRNKEAVYVPGKRPMNNWVKAKTEDSIDAIITGFVDPVREYRGKDVEHWQYWEGETPVSKPYALGWKMGVEVSCLDENGHAVKVANVTSGISEFMRQDMAENPQNYLTKIAEIQCMSKDKEALSLRHPRFIKMRDDKSPAQCLLKDAF